MSEKFPYGDELSKQFGDLPLPDSDMSWKKMEAMLDEDKRRRGIIPFFFRNAVWVLLCLFVAGGAWYFIAADPEKNNTALIKKDQPSANSGLLENEKQKASQSDEEQLAKDENVGKVDVNITGLSTDDNDLSINKKSAEALANNKARSPRTKRNDITPEALGNVAMNTKAVPDKSNIEEENSFVNSAADHPLGSKNNSGTKPAAAGSLIIVGKAADAAPNVMSPNDQTNKSTFQSAEKQTSDSVNGNATAAAAANSITSIASNIDSTASPSLVTIGKPKKHFTFSVGITEQQQIPIAGQSTAPYNDNAVSSVWKDYIPGVYVQAQKGKWNLQAGIKYASAQYIAQNSFYQQTRYEASTRTMVQNSSTVQKIYYHQLPISINYTILPKWTVGAGGMFNWLHSTIIENKTIVSDATTNNLISQTMDVNAVKAFTDSFFYASPFSVLLQTEYQFRALSFGLRYSYGVQPYMKYTTPTGSVNSSYAQTLQLIIRLRLWDSSKRK